MEHLELISEYLGGKKIIGTPATELDLIKVIREGLPYSVLNTLRNKTAFSEETIYRSLRISKRTAARRKQRAERLKPGESELLLRLARALVEATEILGSKEKAKTWLTAENRSLGGAIPIELLDTGIGFQQVLDVLHRIEHGVYS